MTEFTKQQAEISLLEFQRNDLLDEIKRLKKEIEQLRATHPRAFKLMSKKKYFIVIANDEPYFLDAYSMIRKEERSKDTWTEEDEIAYQYWLELEER